ncbi:hypothetical protein J2W97_000827 [Paenibacillus jamilae]|nr:hypothetical protein [Paenibacillus jamilae]
MNRLRKSSHIRSPYHEAAYAHNEQLSELARTPNAVTSYLSGLVRGLPPFPSYT